MDFKRYLKYTLFGFSSLKCVNFLHTMIPKTKLFNYETLVRATSGSIGSMIAMSSIYPLDIIKFRMQLGDETLLGKSTFEALWHILKYEGVVYLYQGMHPTLISLGVSNFVYFYTFHGLKSLQPSDFKASAGTDLGISIVAGIVNVFLTLPLWVTNSRLKTTDPQYFTGLLDGIVYIAETEGLQALWAGLGPSLALIANPAIHYTIYEALKRKVPVNSTLAYFVMGTISKAIATTLTYPLQLAQTRQRSGIDAKINSAVLLLALLKTNGPKALFEGLEAKLIQTVVSAAIQVSAYEKITQFVFTILMAHKKRMIS